MPTRLMTASASRKAWAIEFRIAHIGLHSMDLADLAERLQMKGKIGTADGDANSPAALRQSAHHMPADKARTAEHRYEPARLYQFVRHSADPVCKAASF